MTDRVIDTWDELFMTMTYTMALKSKDPNTKLGAIIVGPDNEVRSMGYNSYPRNLNDNVPERLVNPEKSFWVGHAELNAIANAARIGTIINGCRIYVQRCPCSSCAIAVVQAGIKEVIIHEEWPGFTEDPMDRTKQIFDECGVNMRILSCKIPKLVAINNTKIFNI